MSIGEKLQGLMPQPGTVKVVAWAVISLAGIYYISRLKDIQKAGRQTIAPITDAISGVFDAVRFAGGGVEANYSGFVLNPKYISPAYKVAASWISAVSAMHTDNQALFNRLLDPYDTIKPQYRHLIGAEINKEVLGL